MVWVFLVLLQCFFFIHVYIYIYIHTYIYIYIYKSCLVVQGHGIALLPQCCWDDSGGCKINKFLTDVASNRRHNSGSIRLITITDARHNKYQFLYSVFHSSVFMQNKPIQNLPSGTTLQKTPVIIISDNDWFLSEYLLMLWTTQRKWRMFLTEDYPNCENIDFPPLFFKHI